MKIRKFMQSFRLMTVIAAAAGFVACQENTVDTQGEILAETRYGRPKYVCR